MSGLEEAAKNYAHSEFRKGEAKSYSANPDPNSRFMSGKIRHNLNGKDIDKAPY